MLGKPVIRNTQLTVELILRKLAEGATTPDLLRMYPHLTEADVRAVLDYAAAVLANQDALPTTTA
jgi:uncharacterized protein (DUF433 family)